MKKQIKDYPNYEISDGGEVFRGERKLRKSTSGTSRASVSLSKNGVKKTFLVYRLVIETFVGSCPINHIVHHKDGNPINDSLENLEYVSRIEHTKIHPKFCEEIYYLREENIKLLKIIEDLTRNNNAQEKNKKRNKEI